MKRNCAVCGSPDSKFIYHQQFAKIADATLMDGYDVVVCKVCGFGFADNIPDQAAFDKYYQEMSKYEDQHLGGQAAPSSVANHHAIAAEIKPFLKDTQVRILDIGCATGHLLNVLTQNGYLNVMGLEPSPLCAETAKRVHGIDVVTGTLPSACLPAKRFDFIFLTSVLEHIQDIAVPMAKLREILADDGMMYAEVPDVTRFAQFPNAPFQEFSIEHINYFSEVSLANLLGSCGFEVVSVWQQVRKMGQVDAPVLSIVCAKKAEAKGAFSKDCFSEMALAEYVSQSQLLSDKIEMRLNKEVALGRPIIVWGVGTHTQRLLATSRLAEANILAYVDSNPKYHGRLFNGVPIVSPAQLKQMPEPILISSHQFQAEIERQLRNELQLCNELIKLYD